MFRTLLAVFAIVVGIVFAGTFVVNTRLIAAFRAADTIADHEFALRDVTTDLATEVRDLQSGLRGFVITGDKDFLERYETARKALPETFRRLSVVAVTPNIREHGAKIEAQVERYLNEVAAPEIESGLHRRPTEAAHLELLKKSKQLHEAVGAQLAQLRRNADIERTARRAALNEKRAATRLTMFVIIGGAGLLALVFGYLIARRLARSVSRLVRSSERLADGAFTDEIPAADWELDRIATALRGTAAALDRREREAEVLIDLGPKLWRTPSWDEGLQELVAAIAPIVPVDIVSIFTIENGQAERLGVYPVGPLPSGPTTRRAVDPTSAMAAAVRDRAPMLVTDVSDDKFSENVRARQVGLRGFYTIPLESAGRSYGTLSFGIGGKMALPGPAEQRFLTTVARQISELVANRRLERELEDRNEELQRASQAKSAFLAMMSHELRTPLNSIIGFSEVLIDGKFGAINERQSRYLGNVNDSGKHLLRLINDLLDLSKIEAGRLELLIQPCAPLTVLAEAIATLKPLADARSVILDVTPSTTTPAYVSADVVRFKQIFYNLFSNAIKFTPAGGRVRATCEPGSKPDLLRISVIDEGHGILPDDLASLFTPFKQLSAGVEQGGTGLGLALTKQLVELMGGTTGATSTMGTGSTFFIELPIAASAAPTRSREPTDRKLRQLALVVDDDPAAVELLVLALEADGFRTITAATGEQALALAREHMPSVITLDVFLPSIDGWDLLRILRADPKTAQIPVVVITISSDRGRAFSLGAVDHLVKPIDRGQLASVLRRHGLFTRPDGRQVQVLAIDDDEAQLERVRADLEPLGFMVRTAMTGTSGIEGAKAMPPDVILLDLVLPDLSGIEIIDALRRDPKTAAVPILMVTGHDLTAEQRAQIAGGVEAVLAKHDLDASSLVAEIRRVVAEAA